MNLLYQPPAPKFTPRQIAAQDYDSVKRKILCIDEDGRSTKTPIEKETPVYHAKLEACATKNKMTVEDVLSQLNKPKTQIEINQKAKLSDSEAYLTLKKLVNANKVTKLKFRPKSSSYPVNRLFYILMGKPYDTTKFVEVVK